MGRKLEKPGTSSALPWSRQSNILRNCLTATAALFYVLLSCIICPDSNPPPVQSRCAYGARSVGSAADLELFEQDDCLSEADSPQGDQGVEVDGWVASRARPKEFAWWSQTREEPDESTLVAMTMEASELGARKKYAEAEQIQFEVLAARRRVLGAAHPSTLNALGTLASYVAYQRKDAESERLHRELLAVEKRVRGEEHRETLATLHNLAFSLQNQGKYSESDQLYRELIASRTRIFGPESPERWWR